MPPNPSLKQKLSNLSLAPSAPSAPSSSGPFSSWPLRGDKRKQLFTKLTPPWAKPLRSPLTHEYHEWEGIQGVMAKLIFQAGVDFEFVVVINASALPDPNEVNYDLLLSRILSYLNLYVESDYTVVFFAAGGGHSPGWNWVWKAYRSLSRKYRKNLKQMYIVHPSFFTKMLFSLAGAIISPKFFRKIVHIATLSELAHVVPLTQIDIPPAVYRENAKYEDKITLPIRVRSSIFGVPLEELMGYHGEKGGIPRVVRDSIQFLRDSGLESEGLFRRSPSSAMLRAAQDAYDRGNVVSLNTFGDPFLAAVLIKKYLRDLPDPIFPEKLYPTILRCPSPTNGPSDMAAITYIRDVLFPELVPCAYILLSNVLHLMHEVSLRASVNKMDAHNLTIVLSPNLVKGSNPIRDSVMCLLDGPSAVLVSNMAQGSGGDGGTNEGATTLGMIIRVCIQRYFEVFDEVTDRNEPVPVNRVRVLNGEAEPQSNQISSSPISGRRPVLPTHLSPREGEEEDVDEDIDDTMLVMPIEPGFGPGKHKSNTSVQWARGVQASTSSSPNSWKSKNQRGQSSSNDYRTSSPTSVSAHTNVSGAGSASPPYATMNKVKSNISIEGGAGTWSSRGGKRGSISIGRSSTGKSVGAGVEALGVTASGFFAPPDTSSPTSGRRSSTSTSPGTA
ncbi:hypothetical protein AGABI2DRAFT_186748 [Agaricus bisporus var. bisporus H97]|uniref:hypothetical protein n=1 Tax=Agaricus bisporus var. bisporus (strain H97 / ATCC MYA-4626 / FGSC 10389) TaxID=936046 RepID=UPI00029F63B6|nr:hypothetical protein AGABI2DRAFT_186748 [Agaricus bisporus var. bisporus H97]EKV46117.1 hypothetical protein AGABI2DRAFT_186748 [Agaricus bisporus var. bisporus H97]